MSGLEGCSGKEAYFALQSIHVMIQLKMAEHECIDIDLSKRESEFNKIRDVAGPQRKKIQICEVL